MRTTLNLDESILDEVMSLTTQTNRSEAVRIALQAYIHQANKDKLLELRGKLKLENNWQTMREMDK